MSEARSRSWNALARVRAQEVAFVLAMHRLQRRRIRGPDGLPVPVGMLPEAVRRLCTSSPTSRPTSGTALTQAAGPVASAPVEERIAQAVHHAARTACRCRWCPDPRGAGSFLRSRRNACPRPGSRRRRRCPRRRRRAPGWVNRPADGRRRDRRPPGGRRGPRRVSPGRNTRWKYGAAAWPLSSRADSVTWTDPSPFFRMSATSAWSVPHTSASRASAS